MTVSVNNPVERRQKTYEDLDIILKGVGIAQNFYNAKMDSDARNATLGLQKEANEINQKKIDQEGVSEQKKIDINIAEKQKDRDAEMARERLRQSGEITKKKLELGATKAPPKIGAGEAAELGVMSSVSDQIDALEREYNTKASSMGSGISSWIRGTDANIYDKTAGSTLQDIGKNLEGGKMTDADREFYQTLVPSSSSNNDVASAQFNKLRDVAAVKLEKKIEGLKKAGYDTTGFEADLQKLVADRQKRLEINPSSALDPETQAYLAEKARREALKRTVSK